MGSFFPGGHFPSGLFPDGFFPDPGSGAPVFIGPSIDNLVLAQNVAIFPRDFSALFTGPGLTFSAIGTLPTGLTLSSAGVLSGTPTVIATSGALQVHATDGSTPADSNTFSIQIVASIASAASSGFVANSGRMMCR